MPDYKNPHWTEDEVLLSQFVLGRTSVEVKKELEEHLRICSQCREAVQKERGLASGIRQYGRKAIKSRLKNQLDAKSAVYHKLLTWQRVVSAAAVVVIITGVGIFSHWFSRGENHIPILTQESEKTTKPSGGEVATNQSQKSVAQSDAQSAHAELGRSKESRDDSQVLNLQGAQTPVGAPRTQSELTTSMKGMQNLSGVPSTGEGAISMKKDLGNLQDQIGTEQANVVQFWAEGRVLREQRRGANNFKALKKAASPDRNIPESKQSARTIDRQQPMHTILDWEEIAIRQQNTHFLPPSRQEMQREDSSRVQMQVKQSDQGTTLTMYLDVLFDETELREARVEQVAPDSIVIEAESRAIGFKIPIDLLELQKLNQKTKRR
jgi:hypothetical protein